MQLLADENVPGAVVRALRQAGHDVAWICEDSPGAADAEVAARAARESRVLVTFDKDFGEVAWRSKLPASSGVLLFRMPMPSPEEAGALLTRIIGGRYDWVGYFSVVEPARIRMRPLP